MSIIRIGSLRGSCMRAEDAQIRQLATPSIYQNGKGKPSYANKSIKTAEEYRTSRGKPIPMEHMGSGWDVAYASLFLASDEAAYTTATTLVVDGGVTTTCPEV